MPIKICHHCQSEFFSRSSEGKFCNRACYDISHAKARDNINCIECNTKLKGEQTKFCSQSCAAIYNNRIRPAESRDAQKQSLKRTLTAQGKVRTDKKVIYRKSCSFKFNIYSYKNLPGYALLLANGVYHPIKNPQGVCRDHMLSVEEGYKAGIDPEVLSHPANCQFLTNRDNCKKGTQSSLTYEELCKRIESWNNS